MTNESLALARIYTILSGLVGLKKAYAEPPESLNEFPCSLHYVDGGELSMMAPCFADLIINFYHNRPTLAQAVHDSRAWPGALFAALKADVSLGGAVAHVVFPIRYRAMAMSYNNTTLYGVRCTVRVKWIDT